MNKEEYINQLQENRKRADVYLQTALEALTEAEYEHRLAEQKFYVASREVDYRRNELDVARSLVEDHDVPPNIMPGRNPQAYSR